MQLQNQVNREFCSMTYWLIENNVLWIVDPGDYDFLNSIPSSFNQCNILLTHAHFDHVYGVKNVLEKFSDTKIYTNESGVEMLCNPKLNFSKYHGDPIDLTDYKKNIELVVDKELISSLPGVRAYYTPGHSQSCITWVVEDFVFSGDSYIPGVKTVTNLPGCDKYLALQSERLIKLLSGGKKLYAGHYIK